MEKKASIRFIVSAVLWIVIGYIIYRVTDFLFGMILLHFGLAVGVDDTAMCIVLASSYLISSLIVVFSCFGAGFFSLKSVKKHFPDLENTESLKKAATIFFAVLFGIVFIIELIKTIVAKTHGIDITDMGFSDGIEFVMIAGGILLKAARVVPPLIMIPYCRKRIDKLYNSDI